MKRNRVLAVVTWTAVVAIFVSLAFGTCVCWAALPDCFDATCRVMDTQGKPMGTGCCYGIGKGKVWLLTNAHVVEGQSTVACEFWSSGHQSAFAWPATVEWKRRDDLADVAILTIPKVYFGGHPPTAIPLATEAPKPGELIQSIGCLQGAWPTAFRGHVLRYEGSDMRFLPVGGGGRSGSAIFDSAGEHIVGLLYARTAGDTEGMAVSLASLHKALGTPSQCPGGQCPPSGGGKFQPFQPKPKQPGQRQFRIFQPGQQQPPNPYPGLPPAERPPIMPPIPIPFSPDDDLPPAPPVEEPAQQVPPVSLPALGAIKRLTEQLKELEVYCQRLRTTVDNQLDRIETLEDQSGPDLREMKTSLETTAATASAKAETATGLLGSLTKRVDGIVERVETVKGKAESATATASGVVAKVEAAKAAAEKVKGFATKIEDLRDDVNMGWARQQYRVARIWGWLQGLGWATGGIGAGLIGGAFVLWRRIKRGESILLNSIKGVAGKIKGGKK